VLKHSPLEQSFKFLNPHNQNKRSIDVGHFMKIAVLVAFLALFIANVSAIKSRYSLIIDQNQQQKTRTAKEIFMIECARCHGGNGRAETPEGLDLAATDLTSERVKKMSRKKITEVIINGKGAMPGFRNKLSRKEIAALAGYKKTLNSTLLILTNFRW